MKETCKTTERKLDPAHAVDEISADLVIDDNSAHLISQIYAKIEPDKDPLNIQATINYFFHTYVSSLKNHFDIDKCTVVDCAAGFGWFSFAYILAGGKHAILVELSETRIEASKEIAHILGIENKLRFLRSPIQELPLDENEVELFVSIETLEHVGKDNIKKSIELINRVTSTGVLITTPNKLFPKIAHDTQLPLIHYFPLGKRKMLAKLLYRKEISEYGHNDFASPFDIAKLRGKFKPVSKCLMFDNYDGYINSYPYYLPYGINESGRYRNSPPRWQARFYRLMSSLFGVNSYWALPAMKIILERKK